MTKTCSIDGCGKRVHARCYCKAHYWRWSQHGNPLGGRTAEGEPMRFYHEVVLAYDGEDCLPWPYARSTAGYGHLKHGSGKKQVHRLVCEAVNGPPPTPEHQAAHSCGNGHLACVTKRHLEWKTPAENQADRLCHGTSNRGERNGKAKLDREQVLEIRSLRGIETQKSLADRFGVSPQTVGTIQAGREWSWL